MNRRRNAPRWTRYAVAGVALIAAILAVSLAAQLFSGTLRLLSADGGPTTRDPQFAEPAENATRPPELDENGQPLDLGEDPSANWVYEAETPVDKTAAELSREAEAGE